MQSEFQNEVEDREAGETSAWRRLRERFREPTYPTRKMAVRGAFLSLLVVSAVFGIMVGLMLVYSINLPQMEELARYRPSTTTELYDIHGKVFGSFALERRDRRAVYRVSGAIETGYFLDRRQRTSRQMAASIWFARPSAAYHDVHSKGRGAGRVDADDAVVAQSFSFVREDVCERKIQEIFLTLAD